MFDQLTAPAPDALHSVMEGFRRDPRLDKIDLGVGVFRNAAGKSPPMRAVVQAERELASEAETKAYLPLAGLLPFLHGMRGLFFTGEHERLASIQAAGGTGALRIAMELARLAHPGCKVHLGLPSWPSHAGIAEAAALPVVTHNYFDKATGRADVASIIGAAGALSRGDVFLLHGPCHNPTGAELDRVDREELLRRLAGRGAIPLIDAAYWGLGEGIEADVAGIRRDIALFDRAFVAVSCSKSFGLYRERTGVLFALAASQAEREIVQAQAERISRVLVSMAPAHGAAVVARILGDDGLRQIWAEELREMHARVRSLRSELERHAGTGSPLGAVGEGRGIFQLLPISPENVASLRDRHAIHMPGSGRINITGLKEGDSIRLSDALQSVLREA